MCLTIPAKVTKLEGNFAIIQDSNSTRKVLASFIPDLKIGDWLLYASDTAVRKISEVDAKEIISLLESFHPLSSREKLSQTFKDIIAASKERDLFKEEIIYLLRVEGDEKEALFAEADVLRKTYLKDFICIHGIIEFSNYCKNDCAYCGLRAQNNTVERYRMSVKEIVDTAVQAVDKKGYKLFVLQSGEDPFYTDEMLLKIITGIKQRAKAFIFMSVGERSRQAYKKMKEAGASGILFRFETSNPELFKKFHERGKNLQNRLELLEYLKSIGYFIATGSIVGFPGQTIEDIADDVLLIKKLAHMASFGPFVPGNNTPMEGQPTGDVQLILNMIAVLRLIMKTGRIPVVTALETLAGKDIRKQALTAGANSLMFNLTPARYRPLYKIYPNKFHEQENIWEKYGLFKAEESYQMLEERMREEIER